MRPKQITIGGIFSGGIFRMLIPGMNPKDAPNNEISWPTDFVNVSHFASFSFLSKNNVTTQAVCVTSVQRHTKRQTDLKAPILSL
jgi:hypothetical protein